jgi:hypothetical protein
MAMNRCAQLQLDTCEVILPESPERESFLERWGFFNLLDQLGISAEISDNREPYEESEYSRMLPVTRVANIREVGLVRDLLLRAEGDLLKVLREQACLEDSDVSGLADLVVFELCKNVVEHSECELGGFAIAHASRPSVSQAGVRNRFAAPWEKGFYERIKGEGATEIVVGDAGVGILTSLHEEARKHGADTAEAILRYAFDPFSTSKAEPRNKTRGLWCVKEKVREFRGLLYIRTRSEGINSRALGRGTGQGDGRAEPCGVAAYWDFLNSEDQDKPEFIEDSCGFPGTQCQILLPQHKHDRPQTYVALHLVEGRQRKSIPKPFAVPQRYVKEMAEESARQAVRGLQVDDVLFIDMSVMDESSWDREAVDALMSVIHAELVRGDPRRIWLLNPTERTVNLLRVSTWVIALWREQGVMLPVVRLKELDRPPKVFPVLCDPDVRSKAIGDTKIARAQLADGVWTAVSDVPQPISSIVEKLGREERSWFDDALSRNYAIAHSRMKQGQRRLVPEFEIQELARAAGMMLLESEFQSRVEERVAKRLDGGPRWYRLTSGIFCTEYVDAGIWHDLDAWLRNRIDRWIEERVEHIGPKYIVSYTDFGNALLARALESRPGARPLHLGNYLDLHGPGGLDKLKEVGKGEVVVLLLDISGSGKTIEMVVDAIEQRGATAHVVCLIDTVSLADRKQRPRLDNLYRRGTVQGLVRRPIEKVDAPPRVGPRAAWPVAKIDPVSLLPIPEVLDPEEVMTGGEFWGCVARTGTLSATPITYKGQEFGSFIWLTGMFKDQECAEKIAEHLAHCIDGGRPEWVLITQEAVEFLPRNSKSLFKKSVI